MTRIRNFYLACFVRDAETGEQEAGGWASRFGMSGEERKDAMRKKNRQPGREGLQERDWTWGEGGAPEGDVEGGYKGWDSDVGAEDDADRTRYSLVEKLIGRIGGQLESAEAPAKASVTDLIRLMQWERDLNPRPARKFVVEWVDPKPEAL